MLLGAFEGGTEFPVAGEVPKLQSTEGSVTLFQDCEMLVLSKFRDGLWLKGSLGLAEQFFLCFCENL